MLRLFLIVPTSLRFSPDIIIKCHDTVTKRCETALVCPISYLLRTSCSTHSCPQNSFALSRQQLLHFCSALITKHSSNKTEDVVLRLLKCFRHLDTILLFDHHIFRAILILSPALRNPCFVPRDVPWSRCQNLSTGTALPSSRTTCLRDAIVSKKCSFS